MKCLKCGTGINPLGPAKNIPDDQRIHGCPKCGTVYRDGEELKLPMGQFLEGEGLAGSVKGAMDKVFGMDNIFKREGQSLNSSEAAVIQAVISDLYMQGFGAGVKQGLLLGTIQTKYKEGHKK